jgi:hypothetical protein
MVSDWQEMDTAPKGAIGITLLLLSGREVDALWDEPEHVLSPTSDLAEPTGRWMPMYEGEDPIAQDDPPVKWKPID